MVYCPCRIYVWYIYLHLPDKDQPFINRKYYIPFFHGYVVGSRANPPKNSVKRLAFWKEVLSNSPSSSFLDTSNSTCTWWMSNFLLNHQPRVHIGYIIISLLKGSLGVSTTRVPSQGYHHFPNDFQLPFTWRLKNTWRFGEWSGKNSDKLCIYYIHHLLGCPMIL